MEEGPSELLYRDRLPKAMDKTSKKANRASKEAVWASVEARKGGERRRRGGGGNGFQFILNSQRKLFSSLQEREQSVCSILINFMVK